MKIFLLAAAVIAATAGLTACDTPGQTKVTKKIGHSEEGTGGSDAGCKFDSDKPYIMFVRKATKPGETGAADEIVCVDEAGYNKYKVGDVYP